jgi:hypothetical protein
VRNVPSNAGAAHTELDLEAKKALLFSLRVQHMPASQPVKEWAIDEIVLQGIFSMNRVEGLTAQELITQGVAGSGSERLFLGRPELDSSLLRLSTIGKIAAAQGGVVNRYKLTPETMEIYTRLYAESEARVTDILKQLLRNTNEHPDKFVQPFVDAVSRVFSYLTEEYVEAFGDRARKKGLHSHSIVEESIVEAGKHLGRDRQAVLRSLVIQFIQDEAPKFRALKWNLAQNYYVARMLLDVDQSGRLLAREVFKNAEFYLDTNVVLMFLLDSAAHYPACLVLLKSCTALGIDVWMTSATVEEAKRTANDKLDLIEKIRHQVPPATEPKVADPFYEEYVAMRGKLGEEGARLALAKKLLDPAGTLQGYGVKLCEDAWLTENAATAETVVLSEKVRARYLEVKHRTKTKDAGLHDALMLMWIRRQRDNAGRTALMVTLDTSLPGFRVPQESDNEHPMTMYLDAVLHWLAPVMGVDSEGTFPEVFSRIVRARLLPQEQFFDAQEFRVFSELGMECAILPAEDVEACLSYLRAHAAGLDPSKPLDREKLYHELERFFSDPSHKFKADRARLQRELAEAQGRFVQIEQHKIETERIADEHRKALNDKNKEIAQLKQTAADAEADRHKEGAELRQKMTNVEGALLDEKTERLRLSRRQKWTQAATAWVLAALVAVVLWRECGRITHAVVLGVAPLVAALPIAFLLGLRKTVYWILAVATVVGGLAVTITLCLGWLAR